MPHAKRLTREKVTAIRRRREAGEKPSDLARAYNVSRNTIWRVTSMKTWRQVDHNQEEFWPHT